MCNTLKDETPKVRRIVFSIPSPQGKQNIFVAANHILISKMSTPDLIVIRYICLYIIRIVCKMTRFLFHLSK